MYKKLLIVCVSMSILSHGAEESKPTTQEVPVRQSHIKNATWAWWVSVASIIGGYITGYKASCEAFAARQNMSAGFELNKQWLGFIKEHPDLDITPPVKNVIDKITEQTQAWEIQQRCDLTKYTHTVLRDAQKLPGDHLIEKAVYKNLAWEGYYDVAFTVFMVCAYAALMYCVYKNLPEKQNNDAEKSEMPEHSDTSKGQIYV